MKRKYVKPKINKNVVFIENCILSASILPGGSENIPLINEESEIVREEDWLFNAE